MARGGAIAAAVGVGLLAPGPLAANAAEPQLVVEGAGFGHGVGMSQWGAYGMARRGVDARAILAHYYTGTSISRLGGPRPVRVALQWGQRSATVSGASQIGGLAVRPDRSYALVRDGAGVAIELTGAGARRIGTAPAGVRVVSTGGPLRVGGRAADGVQDGSFRGRIDVLPDGDGVLVVNELELEDYLRGVITEESPASWPAAALEAQAIAARTYAITTPVGGRPFDQWPDTRSQVYTGVSGESAAGDAAVRATARQVVTVDRRPVTTFFFSASGGQTEDSRNVFGGPARSWLRSVEDPDDGDAPLHRWTRRFSLADADARLARFGVGSLERIEVEKRGESPRIVRARIVGAAGAKTVDGGTIQRAFELPERWATFAVVSISACLPVPDERKPDDPPAADGPSEPPPAAPTTAASPDDWVAASRPEGIAAMLLRASPLRGLERRAESAPAAAPAGSCRLVGGLNPAPAASASLEQRRDGDWVRVRSVDLDRSGTFDLTVPEGRWRVRAGAFETPAVRASR